MRLFLSKFTNKVDRKGRVSVPAPFRTALATQTFAGISAYRSFTAPCIEGCDTDFLERLAQGAQTFDAFSSEQAALSHLIFADTHQLPWDAEGRIVLPEKLIAHANISDSVTFVGLGQTFQVWEPAAYEAVEAEIRAKALRDRPTVPLPMPPGGAR